ncbi:hypothetical protein WBP06_03130 [Novosphingobium sp. BL-8H]|uniref:hypothetical protein n=1 Tax=Novosphingobium sp. BL-8H TaxID=3127640 RepID=UPI003757079C
MIDAEPSADAEALEKLALWSLRRCSPMIALDPPDGLMLDVTGVTHTHGGAAGLLRDVLRRSPMSRRREGRSVPRLMRRPMRSPASRYRSARTGRCNSGPVDGSASPGARHVSQACDARPALLPRPETIETVALLPDHPPVHFVWRGVRRRVMRADGPERIYGEWHLSEAEWLSVRDYFLVEDETGARYWVFRQGDGMDLATGGQGWFLHGLFG